MALALRFVEAKRVGFVALVQEPLDRGERHKRAGIGHRDGLAQLAVPRPEAEPAPFESVELERIGQLLVAQGGGVGAAGSGN
ncbi:hypothetical protein, partial [Pseudonocardia halophobica]|uniref:hypothetical protein n=1 Tax=Pseudonocardia halophobica TaxID=29401 RepID=UPI0022F2EB84